MDRETDAGHIVIKKSLSAQVSQKVDNIHSHNA